LIGPDDRGRGSAAVPSPTRRERMSDVAMLAAGVGFFVVAVLYVLACERM
jgi:hypothetical protein